MHELGICDALLRQVDGIVKDEQLEGVNSVTIEIGSLSGVMPNFMADCWQAVIDGTKYQDTELIINEKAGTAQCMDCGDEFTARIEKLKCPKCGGTRLVPLSGTDLELQEINAY